MKTADYETKFLINNNFSNICNMIKVFTNAFNKLAEKNVQEKIFDALKMGESKITKIEKDLFHKLNIEINKCERQKKSVILYIHKYKKDAADDIGKDY